MGSERAGGGGRELTLVGAGLAGSLLAILLSQRGWNVTVYERLISNNAEPPQTRQSARVA